MEALAIGFERAPWPIIIFVLGTLIGSFLNVVIARLPEGESVVSPGSRCPQCKKQIRAWQNIPIISWVLLRGKCANCKLKISIRYPMVELLTGVLFLACWSRFQMSWALLLGLILSASLVAITFIDIDIFEIPDEISLPGIVIGAILHPIAFDTAWFMGLLGAALGAAFLGAIRWGYYLWRKTEGMGLGDVKLIAMIGAFLGPFALLPTVMVASVAGTILGVTAIVVQRLRGDEAETATEAQTPKQSKLPTDTKAASDDDEDWTPPPGALPFGPFLAIGALSQLLLGPAFERWTMFFRL